MVWASDNFLRRIGLSQEGGRRARAEPVVLTGAAADPQSGLIVSLTSTANFDADGNVSDIGIKYWRHLPYGESRDQNLIRVSMAPSADGKGIEPAQVWVQSRLVYDRARDNLEDPDTKKNVNRVLEAVNRLNGMLREKGPVENTAKILSECYLKEVTGEDVVVRGLDEKGGFKFSLSPYFTKAAAQGSGIEFRNIDAPMLKTMLGFSANTLEPDKNYTSSRAVPAADPQSGVEYEAGVNLDERSDGMTLEIFIKPEDAPAGVDPKAIPNLVKLSFTKKGESAYVLDEALFLGQKVDPTDTQTLLRLIGIAQSSNQDFARWKYPAFMDSTAQFNMLDMVSPFHAPPALEATGGEFLYGSLHGCGFEKRIENFGDQIGTAALFLQRGTKADGSVSTVGLALDFPFASGGPDSNYDGAIPDYLPFWDDIKSFVITHDHFDHCDGLPYYAAKGMMKDKTVYATPQVKYFLDKKMDSLRVPRTLRPKISLIEKEGAFPVRDEDGNVRMWVQHNPNATLHSALCTPYIVTGCYNDQTYNGSVLVYSDGRGFKQSAAHFFSDGTRSLPKYAAEQGLTVTPAKVDRDITTVLHDITSIATDGRGPTPEEVEKNQNEVFSWFDDKGILLSPISTNNAEYTAAINVAHHTGRDITAVGRNAELRLSCMNLFGVDPDMDLRTVRIDPLEDYAKPAAERLIPPLVMKHYLEALHEVDGFENKQSDAYEKALEKAHKRHMKDYVENLPPEDDGHEKSTALYMLEKLQKYGAVVFDNNLNGYLMWKAVMEKQDTASVRATRGSQMAQDFRDNPENLLIFITGTQGNSDEKASTLQKFANFFSLLDTDPQVRSTGYKIESNDYVAIITQSAIPGNEDGQEKMIGDLIRSRDITVIAAFNNGFTVHNPKDHRDRILADLNRKGWKYQADPDGSIRVYNHPIHVNGHGFAQDMLGMTKMIKAETHECHHVPNRDAYNLFRDMMKKNGFTHSGTEPDDFQFFRVDAAAREQKHKYETVAKLNPSYILIRMVRKYGQFFGGFLDWTRATLLRREGEARQDGMMARTEKDGVFERSVARVSWEKVSNADRRAEESVRYRKLGPSITDRDEKGPQRPRSRPMFSGPAQESPA